jgi:RNA polymerase sigma-70 factor (ECF subfamily)
MGALFDQHFGYVWGSLRRLGVHEADLEDLAHEVFLRVHKNLGKFDQTRPLRPWLFGFCYRVAADHLRLARHRLELIGVYADAVDSAHSPEEEMAHNQEKALVRRALAAMPLERRAVLVLHDVDGVRMADIAEALGIPLNTAYSRARLAREELARSVQSAREKGVRRG